MVYLVISNNVMNSNTQKIIERIEFADLNKEKRDCWFRTNKHKGFFSKSQRLLDLKEQKQIATSKLDGLQKLVFGITEIPQNKAKIIFCIKK